MWSEGWARQLEFWNCMRECFAEEDEWRKKQFYMVVRFFARSAFPFPLTSIVIWDCGRRRKKWGEKPTSTHVDQFVFSLVQIFRQCLPKCQEKWVFDDPRPDVRQLRDEGSGGKKHDEMPSDEEIPADEDVPRVPAGHEVCAGIG